MVQLIKQPQIITKAVQVQDGKCEITIKLDLNLNIDGTSVVTNTEEKEKEKIDYTIPDFQLQKIKFGEKVK